MLRAYIGYIFFQQHTNKTKSNEAERWPRDSSTQGAYTSGGPSVGGKVLTKWNDPQTAQRHEPPLCFKDSSSIQSPLLQHGILKWSVKTYQNIENIRLEFKFARVESVNIQNQHFYSIRYVKLRLLKSYSHYKTSVKEESSSRTMRCKIWKEEVETCFKLHELKLSHYTPRRRLRGEEV